MFKSVTEFSFKNRVEVEKELKNTLKNNFKQKSVIGQNTFFHKTRVYLFDETAKIEVTFSKIFYIIYLSVLAFFLLLPKESAFIWSSAIAVFVIFSLVMYFSLDYKIKTILDGF